MSHNLKLEQKISDVVLKLGFDSKLHCHVSAQHTPCIAWCSILDTDTKVPRSAAAPHPVPQINLSRQAQRFDTSQQCLCLGGKDNCGLCLGEQLPAYSRPGSKVEAVRCPRNLDVGSGRTTLRKTPRSIADNGLEGAGFNCALEQLVGGRCTLPPQ